MRSVANALGYLLSLLLYLTPGCFISSLTSEDAKSRLDPLPIKLTHDATRRFRAIHMSHPR
jgi:hypothetical protein